MINIFTTHYKGPLGSDGTAPYDVVLNKKMTVNEFINAAVASTDKLGHIEIRVNDEKVGIIGYNNGNSEIVDGPIKKEDLDRPVVHVTANGGWTQMNYIVNA